MRSSLDSWCSSPKCATWSLSVSRKCSAGSAARRRARRPRRRGACSPRSASLGHRERRRRCRRRCSSSTGAFARPRRARSVRKCAPGERPASRRASSSEHAARTRSSPSFVARDAGAPSRTSSPRGSLRLALERRSRRRPARRIEQDLVPAEDRELRRGRRAAARTPRCSAASRKSNATSSAVRARGDLDVERVHVDVVAPPGDRLRRRRSIFRPARSVIGPVGPCSPGIHFG